MSNRDSKGRFSKTLGEDSMNEAIRTGFRQEIDLYGSVCYFLWRAIPFALVIFIAWRYFKISKILTDFLIELACGEGCKCQCTLGEALKAENSQPSKVGL